MQLDTGNEGGYVEGAQERRNPSGILPVTIKQLLNAQKSADDFIYSIDGVEVSLIKVVGQIFNCQMNDNFFSFRVEDGTGSIDGRIWFESDLYSSENRNQWKEGTYVSIIGTLKNFSDRNNISAKRIRIISDFNEVTYHNTESLFVHLHNVKNA